jgi:hypothetical protein
MNGLISFNSIYLKFFSLKSDLNPSKPDVWWNTSFYINRVHELRIDFYYVFLCIFVPAPSLCRQAISLNWIHFSGCITFIQCVSSALFLYGHATQLSWIFCPTGITFLPFVICTHPLYTQATCFLWIFCPTCITLPLFVIFCHLSL